MSTENKPVQDEMATTNPAAEPAASEPAKTDLPVENLAGEAAVGETTPDATSATSPAAEVPPEEIAEVKKKLQLNPQGSENAKAVPSLGGASAPTGGSAPVEIPAANDADVEAAIAETVNQMVATQASAAAPASSEPVEIPAQEPIEASIEAAIEQALAGGDLTQVQVSPTAVQPTDIEQLTPGKKISGVVQTVSGDSVFVDFGLRLTGAVPFRQFDVKNPPKVGDTLELVFDKVDDAEGLILANRPRGVSQVKGDWNEIAPDQVVECVVTKTNKGGLEVTVGRLRGFIPASQVDYGFVADLTSFVGQKLRVRVTEVNPAKRKLVLSRRALLLEERQAAKADLLGEIQPDQVRTGRVKTIKDYGAFVDLGGMDGFLPIGQMSWVRIAHPSEVLQEGQEIEVKILSIDREKEKIGLGMRQLSANPWRTAEDKYPAGANVTGRVTRTEAFGAFVELEPGIEGLVHISELEHRRVKRVTEIMNAGDMVEVQVIEVDPKKKRISLSAKALKAKPAGAETPKDEELAPGKGEAYQRRRREPLKGGTGDPKARGGLFGNPRDFT